MFPSFFCQVDELASRQVNKLTSRQVDKLARKIACTTYKFFKDKKPGKHLFIIM